MPFWKEKRVLVTGGTGFIGSHLVERLVDDGAQVRVVDNLEKGLHKNLTHIVQKINFLNADLKALDGCLKATDGMDVVMNLAAKVGGIKYNQEHPGEMFYGNIMIGANMLEASRLNKVERFLVVSSACVYPRYCKIPTPETEGFVDIPEPTNEGYGWAKRMAEFQGKAFAKEYGMKIAIARPYNAYGPRDHFDTEKSHVIAALIKRIIDGENPLVVWGNGEQSRAFLYVDDFVQGLLEVAEKYAVADPVNLGPEEEIKIKDLVGMITNISGIKPEIIFDASKPSGQPRRKCDTIKAKEKIGYVAKVKLEEGLKKTIEWYKKNNSA